MKNLIALVLLTFFSLTTFAQEKVSKLEENNEFQILDLVLGIHQTYSKSSGLEAKAIELLGGDGMNPTRIVLVLRDSNDYFSGAHMYELGTMLYKVTRITFLDIDTIVINYLQDSFDNVDDTKQIQVKKSMVIKALRGVDKRLTGEITVNELR